MIGGQPSGAAKWTSRDLFAQLLRDPPVAITLIAVVAMAVFSFLPFAEQLQVGALYGATPVFLIWNLFWLAKRGQGTTGEEHRFWRDLTYATGAWWTGSMLILLLASRPVLPMVLAHAVFAMIYVFLLRASERALHEPSGSDISDGIIAVLFVAGLFVYWILLGTIANTDPSQAEISSRLLYVSISSYLAARFAYLAWRASGPWRATYLFIGMGLGCILLYTAARLTPLPSSITQALWYMPFLLWLIASRLPAPTPGTERQEVLPTTRHTALAVVLVLPVIHFAGYGIFKRLDPGLRDGRELLVCAWLLMFGSFAIAQRHRLHAHLRGLIEERRVLTGSSDARTDLRVILEKQRTDEAVLQSAEKYRRAFDLCPDAIGISTLADGRFLEINTAFERLTGYPRDEVIGRSSAELRIWIDDRDRDRITTRVQELGVLLGLVLPFRGRDGKERIARFTAQPIEIEGEPCMILVARELEPDRAKAVLHSLPPPLDAAPLPALLVERDGTIGAWNAAAERDNQLPSETTPAAFAFDGSNRAWARARRQLLSKRVLQTSDTVAFIVDGIETRVLLLRTRSPQ